ncbi:radical SAM protein [Agrobacterium rubi]|nr:radical SAM protein [Agrobacterium rubi]NTF24224.1 radical SAM protein [Agrobacterium rubi]
MGIGTAILKPTKFCNADCLYCSAPPEVNGAPKWSIDEFKELFDKLHPYLTPHAVLLWHGGEPMLMGADFYWKAWEYVQSVKPGIRFSMQSNILAYDSRRWKDLMAGPFAGSISTSFDPDEQFREFRGSTARYTQIFNKRLDAMLDDGFRPKIIGTYTEQTIDLAMSMYDRALALGDRGFDIRINYRYPAGRDQGQGEMLLPKTYGRFLLDIYNRWIGETPDFVVTPLDEMFKKAIGLEAMRCPWTRQCGGHFLGIEPNFNVYNCSEFADLGDDQYTFGNIREMTVPQLLASRAARSAVRRRVDVPADCKSCRHFNECEGGCMRDAVLYGKGLGGKFHYCKSWMMVFDRIKETIRNGEADAAIRMYGLEPSAVRSASGLLAAA